MPPLRAAVLVLLACAPCVAAEVNAIDRAGLGLTVYQDEVGLVHDRRACALERGASTLVIDGVARTARPATATLRGPGLAVSEHAFDLDGVSAPRLLAAAVGREATVLWREGDKPERARVLAADGVPVFEIDGKVVAGTPVRILYDSLPPSLRPQPSFRAAVTAEAAGRHEVELDYLAGGLSWSGEAMAELDGDHLALTVSASVTNESGADFSDATLRLVAGSINQAPPAPVMRRELKMGAAMAVAEAPRETLGPYHMWTVAKPVSLQSGATSQVPLFTAQRVPVVRELVLDPLPPRGFRDVDPGMAAHPHLVLRFANDARSGLGKPLPAGTVRVFDRGRDGSLAFLGEDQLPATPEGAQARIALGRAFDVTARRTQTDFQKVSAEVSEAAWEVRLANGSDHAATVTVREAFPGDWLVIDESAPHTKDDAHAVHWSVPLPARGEAVIKYRVRVKG
jgi:hypothetical protein